MSSENWRKKAAAAKVTRLRSRNGTVQKEDMKRL
jgi:hypothetical protein